MNIMKTAFVFPGGGSLGAIEVGMLKALVESGIHADMAVGASVGSINGTYYAAQPDIDGVLGLEQLWLQTKRSNVFPKNLFYSAMGLIQKNHLIKRDALRKLVEENIPVKRLEDTKIPVYIVAMDINTGEEVIFSTGPSVPAILASAAIPMVFEPVELGRHTLVDGGVLNNTPISIAVENGAERVVILTAGYTCARKEAPKSVIEMAMTSSDYLVHKRVELDLKIYAPSVDLRIIPSLCPLETGSHDFSKTPELITRGYDQAKEWLDEGMLTAKDIVPKVRPIHTHD